MFVLGVDPGLAVTGYGVIDDSGARPRAVAAGVIRTSSEAEVADRLVELRSDLAAIIGEHHPDVVAVEQVFTNRNLKTSISVGRASGVVLLAAAEAGLAVHEYTPSAIKAAVTGFGGAPKDQVTAVINMRLGVRPAVADAADALAVALCHVQSVRLEGVK
jgi:crossover junction endodeoxyribonuclease RuvC